MLPLRQDRAGAIGIGLNALVPPEPTDGRHGNPADVTELAGRQPREDALLRGDAPGAHSGAGPDLSPPTTVESDGLTGADACVAGFAIAGSGRPRGRERGVAGFTNAHESSG